jgi:hypothetical protein
MPDWTAFCHFICEKSRLAIQMTGVTIRWCIEREQSDVAAAVNQTLAMFGQLFSA